MFHCIISDINWFYKELLQVNIQDWTILTELTTTPQMPYEQKLIGLIYWWYEGGWWQNNKPWTTPRGFISFWRTNMLSLELDEYIYFQLFSITFLILHNQLIVKSLNTFLKSKTTIQLRIDPLKSPVFFHVITLFYMHVFCHSSCSC